MLDLWTLPSGVKLPGATGQDVRDTISYHKEQLAAHRRAINFYESIAARVEPKAIVGEVLSHEDLAAMLEKAER